MTKVFIERSGDETGWETYSFFGDFGVNSVKESPLAENPGRRNKWIAISSIRESPDVEVDMPSG